MIRVMLKKCPHFKMTYTTQRNLNESPELHQKVNQELTF
jgi:hypothetical protein